MGRRRVQWAVVALVLGALAVWVYRRVTTHSQSWPSAAGTSSSSPCVDFHDAASQLGKTACVSGRVLRVFTSRAGNVFLDFCTDYRRCPFSTVIFSSDRGKFGDLSTLGGRAVEIRGTVTSYHGRAEIIIRDPSQIRTTD